MLGVDAFQPCPPIGSNAAMQTLATPMAFARTDIDVPMNENDSTADLKANPITKQRS